MAELALFVGPDRSADLALRRSRPDEIITIVPLLQPVAPGPLDPARAAPPPGRAARRCASGCSPASPAARSRRCGSSASGCAPW